MKTNEDESRYEYFERIAILLENNPKMTEREAKAIASKEMWERRKRDHEAM